MSPKNQAYVGEVLAVLDRLSERGATLDEAVDLRDILVAVNKAVAERIENVLDTVDNWPEDDNGG